MRKFFQVATLGSAALIFLLTTFLGSLMPPGTVRATAPEGKVLPSGNACDCSISYDCYCVYASS